MLAFTEPLFFRRVSAGVTINGFFKSGAVVRESFMGSLQPLSGDELLLLPEGDRTRQSYKLYTKTQLFTDQESEHKKADLVEVDGVDFKVMGVEHWRQIIPHFKVIISKVNEGSK